MSARKHLRELPPELRDVPAVAVCAQCGDPLCPGHDLERSGERPVHRVLPWEDGETPALKGLFATAMAVTADATLWVRASRSTEFGLLSAFTFALTCELLAVCSIAGPVAVGIAAVVWRAGGLEAALWVLSIAARIGALFVPVMLSIHLVYQLVVARIGRRLGGPVSQTVVLRAALFACGWDLATGPIGVVAALLRRDLPTAHGRLFGHRELFVRACSTWLAQVHGVSESTKAERAARPWLVLLLVLTCLGVAGILASSVGTAVR